MTVTRHFRDYSITATSLQEAAGDVPYYCEVHKEGAQVFNCVIDEAGSVNDAIAQARWRWEAQAE